jgi:predicted  nucleic acid-binding Zn-ribbon protein
VSDAPSTSWKQWKLPQLNLGTLVSILIAVGFIVWQGMMIRAQIDDNSQAVGSMAVAVEDLAGAVSLANELDTRTNILFDEIGSLRDQYQEQADVWIEISTQAEQIATIRDEASTLRTDIESTWHQQNEFRIGVTERIGEFEAAGQLLSDLQWQVDDLNRRVAEAFGAEMASGGDDYGWQITDLQRMVAEIQGRQNAGVDIEWKLEDLENSIDWEIDELTRRVTELQVRMDTGVGVEQWQIDDLWNHSHDVWGRTEDLYIRTDDMYDMVRRMWSALESRSWPHEYLYD